MIAKYYVATIASSKPAKTFINTIAAAAAS